jgi:hypothetical protein
MFVLAVDALAEISDEAARELAFFRQNLDILVQCLVVGANEVVAAVFRETGDSEGREGNWILTDKEPTPAA